MKKAYSIPLCSFLLLLFLSHAVSQSLQRQEQTVLLKLKKQWENFTHMSQWIPSTNSSSHCSWPGISCTSNSVTGLSLYDVNIITPVPSFICDLKNLTDVNLGHNYIPGEFPRALYNCSKLVNLDLSDNYFVGTIPSDINRLVQLQTLSLGGNNFSGNIPAVIGQLQELRNLNLGGNLFNGSLPPELGSLYNLGMLWLSHNGNLSPSTLPSNYTQLKKLTKLWIASSNLIGGIPESIGDMTALEYLDLSANNLSGKIPDGLFKLKNLSIVYLYRNILSGEIPQVVESLNLTIIDVSQNNLTGRIPQDFAKLSNLTGLALFMNNLSGNIPEGLGKLPNLIDFSIYTNNLSGVLPPDLGKYSKLRTFEVSSNRLEGKLPEQLCSGGILTGVVAYDNNLSGELPEGLGSCSSLTMVKVSNNKFSGTVPSGLWKSLNLTHLMLGNNSFTGVLPGKLAGNLSLLEINDNKFSGNIRIDSSSWSNLVVFKASNNHLTGSIPSELTNLSLLTTLSLDQNQLTGELPSHIMSWKSLNFLNLSQNQLSGQIPAALSFLPTLTNLDLSDNKLSGQIPYQLGHLKLNFLNLASNKLTGIIPRELENGAYVNSFLDNPGLCTSSNIIKLKLCSSLPEKRDKISTPYLVLIITLGTAVFLLVVSFLFFIIRGHWSKNGLESKWKLTSFQRISFTESKIVSGLNGNNLIGSGGFGKVYRVPVNREGDVVAVKKIWNKNVDHKLEQEFLAEVEILSSIRHSNIVKLMCCISSESSKLLVYEYMENRSLDRWLHGKHNQRIVSTSGSVHVISLDWPKRLQIAVGAAQGLCYMHHDCVPPVIHRDIKSSNILLDSEFNPKIADFGLAKLLVKQGELATMSTVAGSFGYMAPEYAHTVRINEKIDVYSFGVVLLELATGREANNGGGDEHSSLSDWAWRHVQDDKPIAEALDPEVKEPCNVEEMCLVFKVGIICTETLPSRRPSMKEVVQLLQRCSRPVMGYGKKFSITEDNAAPLLKNSKRENVLEDEDEINFASIV
ncbi:receptor-like protein kinase HSL1 [Humulus lupulus]|uniref:receptor-like protein kinase HSL1 n=1 Tax=Humulus lupulus TaxID=3486 RepID=UPI002B417B3D|nr:receptor-like protein kinase HSL1 [Humulus lupulus]